MKLEVGKPGERKPEILAPAGTPEALQAALAAGADAVYFGSGPFHARSQAVSFPLEHLREPVDQIHRVGAKAYLTMNTLIFAGEWKQAWEVVSTAYEVGIDALIVQDVGLASSIHQILPDFPIHASTQMAVHSETAMEWAKELGMSRVVLPRELSGEEIHRLTDCARKLQLETEVFVQGALCVCYSGHCHMSRTLGGRSANRGACAQPCRHRYRLEGRDVEAVPLLSPRDLSYLNEVPKLQQMGVASFKIEGRMRSPEYVAQAVRLYRQAVDGVKPSAQEEAKLLQAFNRGGSFSNHRFYRVRGRSFLSGPRSGNLGIFLGRSIAIQPHLGTLTFRLEGPAPDPGDTLVLRRSTGEDLASAPIAHPQIKGDRCTISGFHPEKLRTLPEDTWIYRAKSAVLQAEVRQLKREETPVDLRLSAEQEGYMLRVEDERGCWGAAFQARESVAPLEGGRLRQQLGKLGGTGLRLSSLISAPDVALRISSVNDLRRRAIGAYLIRRTESLRPPVSHEQERMWEAQEAIPVAQRNSRDPKAEEGRIVYLPGLRSTDSLSCSEGTEWVLPLSALLAGSASWRRDLFSRYAVWVAVPSGAPLSLYEEGRREYPSWIQQGLKGEWTSGLVTLGHHPNSVKGLQSGQGDWFLFPDANVANPVTAKQYRFWGVTGLAWAQELDWELQQALCDLDLDLRYFVFEGAQEVMLFEHCPVGYGTEGCSRCKNQRQFLLQDERGRRFPLLPLPEQACSGRLYASDEGERGSRQTASANLRCVRTLLPDSMRAEMVYESPSECTVEYSHIGE